MVLCGSEKLMNIRLASTNAIKQDSVFRQVDLGSNKFVCSGTLHMPTMSHNIKALLVGRATNENHLALRSLRVIQLPVLRHPPTCRRCLESFVVFFIDGLDIKSRLPLNRTKIFKTKSLPNTPLPSTIETFNRRLKTGFFRRCKHRNHIQTQTTPYDFAQTVRPSTSLKNGRVVELGIVRQAVFTPMFNELLYRVFRGHTAHRPRTNQFAIQRNSVQNLKRCSASDTQIFDTVFLTWGKLIQFGDSFGKRLQIPTRRWRQITFSMSSIQFAAPFQNPVDGCSRWRLRTFSSLHFVKDRIGSIFAKSTVFLEVLTKFKDTCFDFSGTPIDRRGCSIRPIRPVDTVKSFAFCTLNPSLDCCFAHTKFQRNRPNRLTSPDGLNHLFSRRREPIVFVSSVNFH